MPLAPLIMAVLLTTSPAEATGERFRLELPKLALTGVPFELEIIAVDSAGAPDTAFAGEVVIEGVLKESVGGRVKVGSVGPFERGMLTVKDLVAPESGSTPITVRSLDGEPVTRELHVIPGLLSLLPPILAIILALVVREVLLALLSGIWLGATFIAGYNPIEGLMSTLDHHLVGSLGDKDHAAIIIFSLTLGGMVGVISRSGGTQGIVEKLTRWANRPRGGQLATWAMGTFIFFDDYANTLIVGNTMRPLADRLRISREKLSFIVDATAAPVTSIAVISSWVGFQVGLVDTAFGGIGLERDAYLTFLASIPYASYSVLMLVFVFLTGFMLRDFGPMHAAEQRSMSTGKVLRDGAEPVVDDTALDMLAEDGTPLRWYNAAIPIMTVIMGTMIGLYYSGASSMGEKLADARLGEIVGAANSFDVLMWSSFAGAFSAIVLAVAQKILTLKRALDAWVGGAKAMLIAMIILVLAWAIGGVCNELGTANYVISITRGVLSPNFLPALTFVIAAFIAFSTGTSWATMAILTPIVVPMAHGMALEAGLAAGVSESILLGTVGAVLSGAVFGDHCSPISDTTIMSSMTSAADHIDHVRTQLPYALTVGGVACAVGYLPAGFGLSPWISLLSGGAVLAGLVYFLGKKVDGREQYSLTTSGVSDNGERVVAD